MSSSFRVMQVMVMVMMMVMVTGNEHLIALGKVEEARRLAGPRWCHGSEGCE